MAGVELEVFAVELLGGAALVRLGFALRRQRMTVAGQLWLQKLLSSTGSSIAAMGCGV